MSHDARSTIETVWRSEAPRVIAALTRRIGDLGLAEDFAQDALVAALEQWNARGVPERPGAWLMAVAGRRAIDHFRRDAWRERADGDAVQSFPTVPLDLDAALDDDVGDDRLGLLFMACHGALPPEARVALTLRLLGGLTTHEIARAFLVPEPTIAQRIVRAKRTLAEEGIVLELPRGAERAARLSSVLEVVYLIFNEGYTATAGGDWMRPALVEEALRLGRVLADLAPDEPEVLGLLALMELHSSRTRARVDASGAPILLDDQDRSLWEADRIRRGLDALEAAQAAGGPRGPYALQAAIAACHARATSADRTDWSAIAALYEELSRVTPSPIVALNHAVAVSRADGPAPALVLVDLLADEPTLEGYHLLPAVRADLLVKLGRTGEARAEFERAASLTENERERALLLLRAARCEE